MLGIIYCLIVFDIGLYDVSVIGSTSVSMWFLIVILMNYLIDFSHFRNPAERLLKSPRKSFFPYAWNNTRTDKSIYIKFDTEDVYEKLSNHVNFHLYPTILKTTLHRRIRFS
jgi:hypothetical protein